MKSKKTFAPHLKFTGNEVGLMWISSRVGIWGMKMWMREQKEQLNLVLFARKSCIILRLTTASKK
jgi:hypothetical protein